MKCKVGHTGGTHRGECVNLRPRWGNSRFNCSSSRNLNYNPEQQQNGSRYNNYDDQNRFYDSPTSQSTIEDDERTHYAVSLRIQPIEMGITAKNKGLGAFNQYFGLCAPAHLGWVCSYNTCQVYYTT